MFSRLFPRHKVRADQAGFIRRGLAFGLDALIIAVLSSLVYTGYAELRARIRHEPSPISGTIKALEEGGDASWTLERELQVEQDKKRGYLDLLKGQISEEEYRTAESMTVKEIEKNYAGALVRARIERARERTPEKDRTEDRAYKVIKEYIITLLYFVLFFRFGGQTPGKRVFRLKVIDLEGKPESYGQKLFEEFNAKHYHQPSDEYRDDWDLSGMEQVARFGVMLGQSAANVDRLPSWNAGEEFLAIRQKSGVK